MNVERQLTRGRIAAAIVVAVLTDLVQLPFGVLFFTGALSVPAEGVDICLDSVAFALTTALLGFHWALLPTFALEVVPVLDALPTWTGCVVFVVWQRRRARAEAAREQGPAVGSKPPTVTLHRDDDGSYSAGTGERGRSNGE